MKVTKSFLTEGEKSILVTLHRKTRNKREADRLKVIILLDKGFSFSEISEILMIDNWTVKSWYSRYKNGGTERLLNDNYNGKLSFLQAKEIEELEDELSKKIHQSTSEVQELIKNKFDKEYTISGIRSLLKRMGYEYKKPKHVPSKANKEIQENWIERYKAIKADKSSETRIYFMDGTHPLHNSQPAYGWIKKGQNKSLPSNTGRNRLNINGAYCIENHRLHYRKDETINAQSTIALLDQIQKEQQEGLIIMISDNARYYKSSKLREYLEKNDRIKMEYLPPYSPNLNIIERLWRFFKKKVTYNKYYEKFSVFENKCLDFFENIERFMPELKTLMTDNFQKLNYC